MKAATEKWVEDILMPDTARPVLRVLARKTERREDRTCAIEQGRIMLETGLSALEFQNCLTCLHDLQAIILDDSRDFCRVRIGLTTGHRFRTRIGGREWKELRKIIIERDGSICAYCGNECWDIHVDHIVPLARGGSNFPENLTVSCPECNTRKGAKLLSEWRGPEFGGAA